jgi:hypothetical protein
LTRSGSGQKRIKAVSMQFRSRNGGVAEFQIRRYAVPVGFREGMASALLIGNTPIALQVAAKSGVARGQSAGIGACIIIFVVVRPAASASRVTRGRRRYRRDFVGTLEIECNPVRHDAHNREPHSNRNPSAGRPRPRIASHFATPPGRRMVQGVGTYSNVFGLHTIQLHPHFCGAGWVTP